MLILARLIGGVFRTRPMDTVMSCSLTYALSRMSLSRRVPSFFCCSSSSSTCRALSKPSSTSASAMRSPNVFTGGMGLVQSEGFADVLYELAGRDQIPQEAVGRRLRQFLGGLLVEWIGGCHQNAFAHPVKGQQTPALAGLGRKAPGQVQINFIVLQGQKSVPRMIA